ncbi:TolC family outer membrane protein [Thiomicrorhabdus indica]|uniref:TolC family outer membrane protein n=1 Tax=Thiomicrorhabdus indica TaxID=2267253 RepID=UPI00102DF7F5|nr:TolC family outer membrane protein [Thiomicrorhabdus indica]
MKNTYVRFACALSLLGVIGTSQAMTLEETVQDAIINNPEFRAEVKRYHSFQSDVRGAESGYYPKIDLNAGIGYEEVDNQTIDNTGDGLTRKEASITVTQNLFNGFGDKNEIKRQEYRANAQAHSVISTANDVGLAMVQAYIDMLKEQELSQLAKDNMRTHQKILDQIIQRNNAGIGNQVEVDQARARLALAESNYAAAENNFYDAQARFRRTLGRNPDNMLVKPVFKFELPTTLEEATDIALKEHPTAKEANSDVAETKFQFKAADRFHLPRVDLEVERTFDENLAGVKGKNEYFQAMLRVRYNLYNGGRDSAGIDRTHHEYQAAVEVRDNTRRQIIENLRFAWNARTYVEKQLDFIEQHIKLTYDTLTGYRKQFTLGRRTLLDLLNTENEYYSATKNLITSEFELLNAEYRVLAGMGHLLPSLNINYDFIETKTVEALNK